MQAWKAAVLGHDGSDWHLYDLSSDPDKGGPTVPRLLAQSATCTVHPDHEPPERDCGCGFAAYTRRDGPMRRSWLPRRATRRVEVEVFLGGPFVGEPGTRDSVVRAASQRVDAVYVPMRCTATPTSHVVDDDPEEVGLALVDGRLAVHCPRHQGPGRSVSLFELNRSLGCPVALLGVTWEL